MLILIHDYAGHPFQVQLSRELAKRGHDVIHAYAGGLLTPRGTLARREGDSARFSSVEVPMSPLYRVNKYSFLKRRGYELAYGRELAALVERHRPDVIISANTPTEPQWTMIQASGRLGIPVISWVQDFYSLAVTSLAKRKLPVLGAIAGWWYRRLDRRALTHSAAIVAITEDFVPILEEFGVNRSKVTVIPNWSPLDELPLRPRHNAWSTRHGLDDKCVFLYTGTLAMKHNPDLLRQLAVRFSGDTAVRIVVVSEGPGAEYLTTCCKRDALTNMLVLPFQTFAEMPEVMASADVLVAILEAEAGVFSVPSKVLTYLTAKRALLGSMPRVNLAARLIDQIKAGMCVDPHDVAAFELAAVHLRESAESRSAMGAKARHYAEAKFDIGLIADRFEGVIRTISKS